MKKIISVLLVLVMLCGLLPTISFAAPAAGLPQADDNVLRMWYTKPANISLFPDSRSWMYEALAIGNGYMGGMVFGGIEKDRIHFNEKTMWAGGPKGNNNYIYGNRPNYDQEQTLKDLQAIREQLDDKSEYVFGYEDTSAIGDLNKLMGDLNGFEAFQDYGDIYLDFARSGLDDAAVTNYVRDLDMRTALSTVHYDYDGVHYSREYFNSYPDNVLVMKLDASEGGKLTFDASMSLSGWMASSSLKNEAVDDTITLRSTLNSNGLKCEAQLKVIPTGGTMTAEGGVLSVTGADSAVLIFGCGTDYANVMPTYRGEDPHEAVTARVKAAAEKGYADLKEDHVADHSALFSRLELSLGEEVPQIPTDELIIRYRNTYNNTDGEKLTEAEQRAAELMSYQFGRYLTIAGSRVGALPTNLQGVWGIGSFAWYGDYHFNINVQMNYWPTLASNLAECLLPFNEYVETLRAPGRIAAASAFGIESGEGEENGWLVGCFSTAFGYAAMAQKGNLAGWNPTGSAWALQNIYEYYQYTGDVEYLRNYIYPSMKEVAQFWNKALWWSDYQQRYVSGPSYSPENGPIVNGASYDQQFVWQHFENTIQAAEILGVDEDLVAQWREKQSKLDPVIIGESGQVKEWFEETTFGRAQAGDLPETDIPAWRDSLGAGSVPHRHISQLVALYPGTLINKDNQEFMDAAMVTLEERGLDATGWSKAHKLNLWARTGHAEESFELVRSAVGGSNAGMLTNLFSSHGGGANYQSYPIFQIDGNFGLTAGINEMLLQSQLGYVEFLPTLPEQWNNGFIEGIMARGNFEIDMKWSDGKADEFKILSNLGGTFTGEYENLSGYTVRDSEGNAVPTTALGKDKVAFETEAGETYTINFSEADDLSVQKTVAKLLIASMTDSRLSVVKETLEKAAAEATDAAALTAANTLATDAMEFLEEINDAQAYWNEKHEATEIIQVHTALEQLAETIAEAEALLKAPDLTTEQLTAKASELTSDQKNTDAILAIFDVFAEKIADAEEFLTNHAEYGSPWEAGAAVLQELRSAIDEAKALTENPSASSENFNASMSRMSSAMKAITDLIDGTCVEIQVEGGVLTLVPSDPQFEIRYTLDGNTPSAISRIYTEPVTLNRKSLTIQAQMYLGDRPYGEPAMVVLGGDNLALNKPVFSPNYYWPDFDEKKAVDGDRNSRWAPYSRTPELVIDLGTVYEISGGAVYESTFEGRLTEYEIQVSTESENGPWTTVLNAAAAGPFSCEIVNARYVRFVVKSSNKEPNIGEIEIYPVPEDPVAPADFTELRQILADAEILYNGIFQDIEPEAQANFEKWLTIAREVAANETSDQETVDAAAEALREAVDALAVVISLRGEDKVTVDDEELTYTLSVSNTTGLATATFEMDLAGTVGEPVLTAQNDWYIISQTFSAGKLFVLMGNNSGVTSKDTVDILTITVPTTGECGEASLKVTEAVLSSFVGETSEAFVTAIYDNAQVTTVITYSTYDVNEDGVVDQLDITRAQRMFGSEGSETRADVDGDLDVDINDLILIANNYSV